MPRMILHRCVCDGCGKTTLDGEPWVQAMFHVHYTKLEAGRQSDAFGKKLIDAGWHLALDFGKYSEDPFDPGKWYCPKCKPAEGEKNG